MSALSAELTPLGATAQANLVRRGEVAPGELLARAIEWQPLSCALRQIFDSR
jgi:hypothetical protein